MNPDNKEKVSNKPRINEPKPKRSTKATIKELTELIQENKELDKRIKVLEEKIVLLQTLTNTIRANNLKLKENATSELTWKRKKQGDLPKCGEN